MSDIETKIKKIKEYNKKHIVQLIIDLGYIKEIINKKEIEKIEILKVRKNGDIYLKIYEIGNNEDIEYRFNLNYVNIILHKKFFIGA